MEHHPITYLQHFYRWVDGVVDEYGVQLLAIALNLAPFLIAWILCGGFWRRSPRAIAPPRKRRSAYLELPTRPPVASSRPLNPPDDDESQAFPM